MTASAATPRPFTTADLDALTGTLRTALVSDILDSMGLRHQCLAPGIRPLDPSSSLIGYAFPVATEIVDVPPEEPYVGLLQALDAIATDDVWMSAAVSEAALWGELTSTASRARGARGTVCDGYIRDAGMIRGLSFPVFSKGQSPIDVNGRVEFASPSASVAVGGVAVASGDLVVADEDGIVIVPAELTAEVVAAALEKSSAESEFRAAVMRGELPSVAYRRYQVL